MIYLDEKELETVRGIISQHINCGVVLVFGSRHKGNVKPYSDLDLAININRKLSLLELATIKESFEISELNFRVDVVDYCSISEEFKKIIDASNEVIFTKG